MVILTGLGKLIFVDFLNLKFVYIITTIAFWSTYFVYRVSKNKKLINYWGLSFSTISGTMKILAIPGLIILIGLIIYGIFTIHFSWNILFVLITYPIWGLVQQFLMMSLFAGNLKDYEGKNINTAFIVIITSFLFSIVHYPSFALIAVTFAMAIIYSLIFLSKRNILPLGIFHGVLGALFYYVVLQRDAWLEFFSILNK
ncbi:MAG TPA: CPBP family glutamic-type intramembrane protease [Bacteroidales bacterium]|nr:CPBP family glutamic-type intramembrane protease [Bacteroidales bacterium]